MSFKFRKKKGKGKGEPDLRKAATKVALCDYCSTLFPADRIKGHVCDSYGYHYDTRAVLYIPWENPDLKKKERGAFTCVGKHIYYRCLFCGHLFDITDTNFERLGNFCVHCPLCAAHIMAITEWYRPEGTKLGPGLDHRIFKEMRNVKPKFATRRSVRREGL